MSSTSHNTQSGQKGTYLTFSPGALGLALLAIKVLLRCKTFDAQNLADHTCYPCNWQGQFGRVLQPIFEGPVHFISDPFLEDCVTCDNLIRGHIRWFHWPWNLSFGLVISIFVFIIIIILLLYFFNITTRLYPAFGQHGSAQSGLSGLYTI